jgi:hypothetical protein
MALFGEGGSQSNNGFLPPLFALVEGQAQEAVDLPLYCVHTTVTPASRNRAAYASPSSRNGSYPAVITRAGGNPRKSCAHSGDA